PHAPSPTLVAKSNIYKKDKHGMATYNDSENVRHVRTTAYSHMENEKGCHGLKSAGGTKLQYTNTVRSAAADWSVYPMGTKFKIKGLPYVYEVNDYGSALVGTNTVDLFKPNLKTMRKWGTRKVELTVIEWGSYEKSRKLLKGRTRYKHCRSMYNGIVRKMDSGKVTDLGKKSTNSM
ncbi:MAG: 3D domain-containing protein, partial [Rubritalea sp.]|uniref:3D domain-containing protein n=1 Tax=Rubritalea sp. TaxID=2109375 RepID=UPI0032426110